MLTSRSRPAATLSLDLDNLWSYMKSGGMAGWESFPSYLDVAVERILEFLQRERLTITVFIVGQDAILAKNRRALRAIAAAGHEIANHSFHHEPWLNRRPEHAIRAELAKAHDAIGEATGRTCVGFRGPGFSLSEPILVALCDMSYRYDASTFPTFIGPLARSYYFVRSGLSGDERKLRAHLFGSVADGLRSLKPYAWRLPKGRLLEIPVTTVPLLRLPFHLSYLSFVAGFSPALALGYFRAAIGSCRIAGVAPSLLLHPLDFLGSDDVDVLGAFPGMALSGRAKLDLLGEVIREYCETFDVTTMQAHAELLLQAGSLQEIVPRFTMSSSEAVSASPAEETR